MDQRIEVVLHQLGQLRGVAIVAARRCHVGARLKGGDLARQRQQQEGFTYPARCSNQRGLCHRKDALDQPLTRHLWADEALACDPVRQVPVVAGCVHHRLGGCDEGGDIGAIAKMDKVKTGDTLCEPRKVVKIEPIPFDEPCYSVAIAPKTRGQEDKMAQGLNRLNEEDPSFRVVNNAETHQMVVSGVGDIQIDVLVNKLKSRFGVEVVLDTPRVPYREKIRKTVQKQGRHKKQTGGHGQFGDVVINFEPCASEQVVFEEKVFGGSVPQTFFPAVEKGVRLAAEKGVLAGYPVVGLKATLLDGSYHPVDSSEMAFIMAAKLAYKAAMPEAGPVILEPIHTLKAHVPNDNTGDIMGDVTKRRGRVLGMEPDEDGMQTVIAEVPLAELSNFTTFIRQITQGRGWFTTEFARYEILPEMLVPAVVEQAKKLGNLDEGAED